MSKAKAKALFRQEFTRLPQNVNWYPGHMRKTMRLLGGELKKVDLFIEVRDARIPYTSHNPELLGELPQQMKRLVVFNKIDLANEKKSVEMIKSIEQEHTRKYALLESKDHGSTVAHMHMSTKENKNVGKLVQMLQNNCASQFKTVGAWVMIGGMPNIGKSTIINSLRRKDSDINNKSSSKSGAKVGARPCLTKSISGFKIVSDPPMYLVDTPGVIAPKIRDESEDGLKLAACHAIRDGILDDELICDYVLFKLNLEKVLVYVNRYALPNFQPVDNVHDLLVGVQKRMGLNSRANACGRFLTDFREGRLGRITLDNGSKD